jgi:hypothetical protein
MIAVQARDDLHLVRLAAQVVVIPHQLDVGVVGVGAGVAEEHLAHAIRRQADQPVGEADGRLRGHRREGVEVAELFGLLMDRLGDLGTAVADVDAPQAGHGVEVAPPVQIAQPRALALHEHPRPALEMLGERREGVHEAAPVELGERQVVGRLDGHDWLLRPMNRARPARLHIADGQPAANGSLAKRIEGSPLEDRVGKMPKPPAVLVPQVHPEVGTAFHVYRSCRLSRQAW